MNRKILEPIEIRGMTLKNRIGFAPILGMPVEPDGTVNSETIRWFEERARGGTGFIMTGTLDVLAPEDYSNNAPVRPETGARMHDDKFISGWSDLISVVHSYDVKIGAQLGVAGPMAGEGPSPSPFPDQMSPKFGTFDIMAGAILPVTQIAIDRMEFAKSSVAKAAARSKAAGFDCVELHCGHGAAGLFASFLSPYYNRRTDEYGGNWENRLRFTVETIGAVRKAVGKDYPIFVRFSADELLGPRGITLEDSARYIVPALEKAGVDAIDVTQGSVTHSIQGISIPLYYPRGYFIRNAETIKKATSLPVIGVGRIIDLDMAEQFLEQGKVDIVYLGSQLGADLETPKKYFEGRRDEIRKCIGCKPIFCGTPCAINYDTVTGRIPLTKAEIEKTVLIIGGGVGGMEAARIAALRGHKVTLMEKEPELGGMVAALAEAKLTGEFRNIITYLGTQMRKLSVDVRVCKEATISDIEKMKPDVVVVACGSSMIIPEVAKGKLGVMDHIQACREMKAIGQRVVIWGLVAAELAMSLAQEGKEVTMIGRGGPETIARDYPGARQIYMLRKLTDINFERVPGTESERVYNPRVLLYVDVKEISPGEIRISTPQATEDILPYDTLIISLQRQSNNSLFDQLQGSAPEVYKIGDCAKVGEIKEAIMAANEVARNI
ncbi:MAG: 2-enoate reductase FldZ [Syntrophorhabdus sp. PtaU1.Bin153]|nr:MAG: 2-enoate reductase FldZ [Syntrophorhabdus sp. PtaU1.Bin153]